MSLESGRVVHLGNPEFEEQYLNYHRYRLKICVCSLICTAAIGLVAAAIVFQIINFSDIFPQKFELGEGDMRAVSVSTLFCEGITLKDDMTKRRLLVLSKLRPGVQTKRSNVSTQVYVVKDHYWYKTFYLLKGSSLLIKAKSDSYFKLIILRGRERLDEWMKTHVQLPHKEASKNQLSIINANVNHGKTTRISYDHFIQDSDNYYVLFSHISGGKSLSLLHISLSVNRVLYDVGPTLYTCVAQPGQTCDAGLLFGSHESVVIEVLASSSQISAFNVNTRWQCDTRLWFYIAIFGGCFFAISLGTIFIYFVCSLARRRRLKAKISKYIKETSINKMLVPPASKLTRSVSIRSHGSLRRYPPTRRYSQTSQTSQATNSSQFKRESRPLLSIPMYDGIPDNDNEEITSDQEQEESDNADEILNVLKEYRRNKRIVSRDNKDMSFESLSSFVTGASSQKLSFSTFCPRFQSNESESEDGENLFKRIPAYSQGNSAAISIRRCPHSTRPRAKSCTTQSPDKRYRHSCAKRSKSYPRFENNNLERNTEENLTDLSSLQQQFSFPATVHSSAAQKPRANGELPRLRCHSDNTVKQPRSNKRHPIKFQAVSEAVDCSISGDVHQPLEDIWVAECTKPVEKVNVTLQEKSNENDHSITLPDSIVKKRDKKRSYQGWKPRLSVVSESEV